jgi:serine protease inhibitor
LSPSASHDSSLVPSNDCTSTEGDADVFLDEQGSWNATEEARQTINQWVERQTANKIKDLIAPGVLTPSTRLVLTNAIYFKGDWQTQFEREDTKDEDFHVSAAQTVKAPLMYRTGDFN